MQRSMFWRPSGNAGPWIISILALVMAMGGTGLAARKYLITSTNQIAPSVLKKLRGAHGAPGPAGAPGAPGAAGIAGAPGGPGPAGSAKGYATIVYNGGTSPSFLPGSVGFAPGGVRSPSTGILCIAAPPGASPDAPLLASPAQSVIGFVGQMSRTVCNPNEYQLETTDIAVTAFVLLPVNIVAP